MLYPALAAAAVSLGACTVAPAPTSPSVVATAEPLSLESGFEPDFYRAFLQNGYESPQALEPVRILSGPLRIYIRDQDDAGRRLDAVTLETTERALIEAAPIWSGGTLGVSEVLRGPGTREKTAGWLTVKWTAYSPAGRCGRSTVGVDGGYIELDSSGACSCGLPTRIYPRVVRHELGHAMGYYHTDSRNDVMFGQAIAAGACDLQPSERERLHARLAYTQAR